MNCQSCRLNTFVILFCLCYAFKFNHILLSRHNFVAVLHYEFISYNFMGYFRKYFSPMYVYFESCVPYSYKCVRSKIFLLFLFIADFRFYEDPKKFILVN